VKARTLRLLVVCAVLALTACATPALPPAAALGPGISTDCALAAVPAPVVNGRGLDPAHIRLLSWNILKAHRHGWARDFETVAAGADLVVLQEAANDPALLSLLHDRSLDWQMRTGFRVRGTDYGVLTAARAGSDYSCALSAREPLLRVPKQIMISRHPIAGSDESLLLANVHMINFTVGTDRFRAQLDALAGLLAGHRGPVVVVGDFNTWNGARQQAVDAMAARLGLQAVHFHEDLRSRFLGNAVDQVYYRGLAARDAVVFRVKTSDHNPLSVEFALDRRGRT